MFSAFKKLTTKQENGGNSSAVSPGNVQCMSTNLQRKFAKVEQRAIVCYRVVSLTEVLLAGL